MNQAPSAAHSTSAGDLAANMAVFRRHLKAENVSPATITAYNGALEQLDRFLAAEDRPRDVRAIRRQDIEAFLADILERRKATTANQRFFGCQPFFNYLVAEGELCDSCDLCRDARDCTRHEPSPMARMKPPRIPETPIAVLRGRSLSALHRSP